MSLRRLLVRATLIISVVSTSAASFAVTTGHATVDLYKLNTGVPVPSAKSVVTIMTVQKTSTSEGTAAVPTMGKMLKLQNFSGEIHVVIENLDKKEQTATVRFRELESPQYDVYINEALMGKWKRGDLESGMQAQLPAGYGAEYLAFFKRIKEECDAILKEKPAGVGIDGPNVTATLSLVTRGCRSAELDFQNSRGASLVLVPADRAMSRKPIYSPLSADEAAKRMRLRLSDLAAKRRVMAAQVEDTALRNRTLRALTPLDFSAVVSKPDAKGVRQVQCALSNLCELPMDAQIRMDSLPGWAKTQPLALKGLKQGKTGKVTFKVKAPASADGLKVKATIQVGGAAFDADAAAKL